MTKEIRTCENCEGKGHYIVDLDLERFKKKLGFCALLVSTLFVLGFDLVKLSHHHVDVFGWFLIPICIWGLRDLWKDLR